MSLRELLKDVALEDKAISQSAFRLVQGLVEAMEATGVDKHIASLAYVHTGLAKAKAEIERLIERLCKALDDEEQHGVLQDKVIERLRLQLERERDEAEVTIEDWCKSRRYWRQQCENARKQAKEAEAVVRSLAAETDGLAEAKAEIDRLRKERDGYRTDWGKELRRREHLILAKVAACNAEEAMRADADLGRLVRGMRPGTQLRRLHSGDIGAPGWSTWECNPYEGRYYVFVESSRNFGRTKADPGEVLRAIQKEETCLQGTQQT